MIGEEKISLTVFNADDNSVIYSEERKLVEEQNDVNRLVAHFLVKVKVERDLVTKAAAERKEAQAAEMEAAKEELAAKKRDEKDLKALNDAQVIVALYSPSDSLMEAMVEANRSNPNECHVYLDGVVSTAEADVILEEKTANNQQYK